ncbi:hypothetical protein P7C73_g4811, partial [Tremellales sp. Uapishka_1]
MMSTSSESTQDWEQGMYHALQPIFSQKTCPSGERVFETLGKLETRIQKENKTMLYPSVLKLAYLELTGRLRLVYDEEAATAFAESVGNWPAFPDSAEALGRLHDMGLKLIILSNVDTASFQESRKKLETGWGKFDAVYVAEDIGTYKPDLRNFHYALHHLEAEFGIDARDVLCVANSRYHDIQPARKIGIQTTWINRADNIMGVMGHESDAAPPHYTFRTMAEFADEMQRLREE